MPPQFAAPPVQVPTRTSSGSATVPILQSRVGDNGMDAGRTTLRLLMAELGRAQRARARGDLDETRRALEAALAIDPGNVQAREWKAELEPRVPAAPRPAPRAADGPPPLARGAGRSSQEGWSAFEQRVRERRARHCIDTAERALAEGHVEAAQEAIEELAFVAPGHADLPRWREQVASTPLTAAATSAAATPAVTPKPVPPAVPSLRYMEVDPAPATAAPRPARRRLVPAAAGVLGVAAALVAAFVLRGPGVAPVADDPLEQLAEAPLAVDDSAEVPVDPEVLAPEGLTPEVLDSPGSELEETRSEAFDTETSPAADTLDIPSTPVERTESQEDSPVSQRAELTSERPSPATAPREPSTPPSRERSVPEPRVSAAPGTSGRTDTTVAEAVAARVTLEPRQESPRERAASLPEVDPPAAGVPASVGTTGVRGDTAAISSLPPPPAPVPSRPDSAAAAVVQPPVSAPPAATPQPQEPSVDPRAEAERAVQQLLRQYVSAYNSLDASAARAVWPGVDSAALERAFSQLSEQRLRFERCSISVDEDAGSATCAGQARWVPRVGDTNGREERRTWQFELGRSGADWIITRAEARR